MFRKAKPFFLTCQTPLHCGSGSDVGIVDLPIQREQHTNLPKIEASSLKGGIREAFEENLGCKNDKISAAFGPESGGDHAGALGFTEARLILFPVKSMKGLFAWVTSPSIISRFVKEMKMAKVDDTLTVPPANSTPEGSSLFIDKSVILEEYTFSVEKKSETTEFAAWISQNVLPAGEEHDFWRNKLAKDIVILSDDNLRDFTTLSTEVITRTKIDPKTGTVVGGALFVEEYLPTDSILYALALTTPPFGKGKGAFEESENGVDVMDFFTENIPSVIQLGGNATIGKGIVAVETFKGGKNG